MIWYDVMWCDVIWCDMMWYDMILAMLYLINHDEEAMRRPDDVWPLPSDRVLLKVSRLGDWLLIGFPSWGAHLCRSKVLSSFRKKEISWSQCFTCSSTEYDSFLCCLRPLLHFKELPAREAPRTSEVELGRSRECMQMWLWHWQLLKIETLPLHVIPIWILVWFRASWDAICSKS